MYCSNVKITHHLAMWKLVSYPQEEETRIVANKQLKDEFRIKGSEVMGC
jgi:hypothetical protein